METTRVPIFDGNGDRDPQPWTEADEELWEKGEVICPQISGPKMPTRKWCLRANETDAVNSGSIAVWDEHEEN